MASDPALRDPQPADDTASEAVRDARPLPDFSDTEETFRHQSDGDLRQATRLFKLMGQPWLTNALSSLGTQAVRLRLPGAAWGVRNTIYRQFVGGVSLEGALPMIQALHERGVTSILDYGSEAGSDDAAFEHALREVERGIEFGGQNPAASAVVIKVTGIAPDSVLEAYNERRIDFEQPPADDLAPVLARLDQICRYAQTAGVQVYIDAEETWFQNTIDQLADEMMRRYNGERVVALNTFQLYRHDRLAFLQASHARSRAAGYLLGAKLVRGAYMVKERDRAEERGYPSPIQPDLASTHRDFDAAVRFCLERLDSIAVTIGSHNEASTTRAAAFMDEQALPRNHPHVRFAQLLGMSDNLTFNLSAAGFNASKYMVYGPVSAVLPYLVRRAQENTSVTGEMGRELRLLKRERERRRAARG
jgi:proline dehydrogenase